jgi:hypothetical protein
MLGIADCRGTHEYFDMGLTYSTLASRTLIVMHNAPYWRRSVIHVVITSGYGCSAHETSRSRMCSRKEFKAHFIRRQHHAGRGCHQCPWRNVTPRRPDGTLRAGRLPHGVDHAQVLRDQKDGGRAS